MKTFKEYYEELNVIEEGKITQKISKFFRKASTYIQQREGELDIGTMIASFAGFIGSGIGAVITKDPNYVIASVLLLINAAITPIGSEMEFTIPQIIARLFNSIANKTLTKSDINKAFKKTENIIKELKTNDPKKWKKINKGGRITKMLKYAKFTTKFGHKAHGVEEVKKMRKELK